MEGRTTERVAVFVDGANLYHSIKNYYKGILDYARLLSAAVGDRKLLRATFYIVEKQEAEEGQGTTSARSFVYNLNKFGYKVRSKPLVVHETMTPEGERTVSHKGDWDIGVVVDLGDVAFMDSTALSALMRSKDTLGQQGISLRLAAPSKAVERIFSVTGFQDYFDIFPSREDAIPA